MNGAANLPGNINHAPGVVCFIAVQRGFGFPHTRNNGKIVVIVRKIPYQFYYHCECGSSGIVRLAETVWETGAASLYCNDKQVTKRLFPQSWLIPIADGESFKRLYESEAEQEDLKGIMSWISQVEQSNAS